MTLREEPLEEVRETEFLGFVVATMALLEALAIRAFGPGFDRYELQADLDGWSIGGVDSIIRALGGRVGPLAAEVKERAHFYRGMVVSRVYAEAEVVAPEK